MPGKRLHRIGFAIAIGVIPALVAETIHNSVTPSVQSVAFVRNQLRSGQVDAALKQAQINLQTKPRNAQLLSLLGEVLFRQSKFEEAEDVYRQAIQADPHCARAQWGLGRLAALRSRTDEARKHFAFAFQNDPRDPDIILSFADYLQDEEGKSILYRNFLALSDPRDLARREDVAAKLEVARQIGQRQVAHRLSPYQEYHFKLTGFSPSAESPKGLWIDVRINGGKRLRLIVDSGASGLYVNTEALKKEASEVLSQARIGGLGSEGTSNGHVILARTVSIGNLVLENCLIRVLNLDWLREADGVIGTDVFREFVVRIDPRSESLNLQPFGEHRMANAFRAGHYLLVRASANRRDEGIYVVDTGASFTLLQSETYGYHVIGEAPPVRGLRGNVDGARTGLLRFAIGNKQWVDNNGISADLSELSSQAGIQISGILGFPLLRQSVLTINYKDGTVDIAPRGR